MYRCDKQTARALLGERCGYWVNVSGTGTCRPRTGMIFVRILLYAPSNRSLYQRIAKIKSLSGGDFRRAIVLGFPSLHQGDRVPAAL
jgi:hypothetical protein